jgi:glycosyltransferase involved in cell wall biosynthesis
MPFFSIIIPTFNRSKQIETAIDAVKNQTYKSFELIVIDDGSTDDTQERMMQHCKEENIHYYRQENKGVCSARNHGAIKAKGEYLIFLDSDDDVLPEWLTDFKGLADQGFPIVYCSMTVKKPNGGVKSVSCIDPYLNGGNGKGISIPGTWAIEANWFKELGGFDEAIKYGENTELKFRMLAQKRTWGFVDHYNFIYNESVSGGSKQIENKLHSNLHILAKHQDYFAEHPEVKRLFLNVAAVSAARLGKYDEARRLFILTWKTQKNNIKSILNCLISIHPLLIRIKWKPLSSNIQ